MFEQARRWIGQVQEEFQKTKSAMIGAGKIDSVTKDGIGEYTNYDGELPTVPNSATC